MNSQYEVLTSLFIQLIITRGLFEIHKHMINRYLFVFLFTTVGIYYMGVFHWQGVFHYYLNMEVKSWVSANIWILLLFGPLWVGILNTYIIRLMKSHYKYKKIQ